MSLLHKALKKAEKSGSVESVSRLVIDDEESHPSRIRLTILVSLAVAALLFLATVRYLKGPKSTADQRQTAPTVADSQTTPLGIGSGPPAPELLERAERLIERQRWEEAREALEKATILEPRNLEAYSNLGLTLRRLGRNEEARRQYDKALAIDPACAECLNNLGVLELSERNLAKAKEAFERAVQTRPDYADPYLHLALVAEAEGKIAEAKRHFAKFSDLAQGIDAGFLLQIQQRMAAL